MIKIATKVEGVELDEKEDFYRIYEPIIPDNRREDYLNLVLKVSTPETLALGFLFLFSDLEARDVVNYTTGVGKLSNTAIKSVLDSIKDELDIDEAENEFEEVPTPEEYREHRYNWFKEKDENFESRYQEKLENQTIEVME